MMLHKATKIESTGMNHSSNIITLCRESIMKRNFVKVQPKMPTLPDDINELKKGKWKRYCINNICEFRKHKFIKSRSVSLIFAVLFLQPERYSILKPFNVLLPPFKIDATEQRKQSYYDILKMKGYGPFIAMAHI